MIKNFSICQLIHQNFSCKLFVFNHSKKFIVWELFNIKTSLIQNFCENIEVLQNLYAWIFFDFRESFALKGVIMKMFVNNCVDHSVKFRN